MERYGENKLTCLQNGAASGPGGWLPGSRTTTRTRLARVSFWASNGMYRKIINLIRHRWPDRIEDPQARRVKTVAVKMRGAVSRLHAHHPAPHRGKSV